MEKYNFDTIIDRRGTLAYKTDGLESVFGKADLTPFWVADMDFAVCPAITEALQKRMAHPIYSYTLSPDSYWQAIIDWQARRNQFHFSREQLTYVPGIVRGIGLAINHFTKPGDRILIQEPVYHPFKQLIVGNGRVPVINRLIPSDECIYDMDLDALESQIAAEKPVLMILCNPHNPGGIIWKEDTLKALAEICHRHNVTVISDEIHGDLALFGHKHRPFATISPIAEEISVTFGAPSKTFNIAGLVSSWVVVKNPKLREPLFNWLSANEFDDTMLVSSVAAEAAYNHGEEWLAQVKEYIEGNIEFTIEFCREHIPAIKPIRPHASYLIWLDCTALNCDQKTLVEHFLNAKMALNDGAMFGIGGEAHMRLNVATPRAILEQALHRLATELR